MARLVLIPLLISVVAVRSANILYVIPFSAKSHYILLRPLGLELAKRGHNVTVITTHIEKDPPPNYHQVMIDPKPIWDTMDEKPSIFDISTWSTEKLHEKIIWSGGVTLTETALNSTAVKAFLAQDIKFDLVINEQFFQEALFTLAHKYNAPSVLITTYGNCMRHNILTRNPLQLSSVLAEFLIVENPRSFFGRLRNWYFTLYEYYWWSTWYLEQQEALVKKYLPDLRQPVPSLYEIQKNTSLILLNSHFSFDPPTAYLPNMIEIGGLHLTKSDGRLPEDLQKILDEAELGVVYLNFGSNVKSSELPTAKKDAFLNVFRRLNHTVLWKWEDDSLTNKPDNVIVRKWFPQKEILSHQNIKVFISHGGLIGTQEAVFHGVPIIGVPIFADQYNNLLQVQEVGFGKILRYSDINEKNIETLLNDVLKDDSYKKNAKEVSRRFKDRPLSALDTAVFWIEYVIRNNGAAFIKNPALNLSWFEYHMLDVIIFVGIVGAVLVSIAVYMAIVITKFIVTKEKLKAKLQ